MADVIEQLRTLASVDIFREGRDPATFIGRPFYFDYSRVRLLVNDKWKHAVSGLPEGAFLLCGYDGAIGADELVLLRVIGPTALPSDSDVVASMVEYYKEETPDDRRGSKLDTFTRYEFMFSGLECRVLGSFYKNGDGVLSFGADIETFYSSHNYSVFKPQGKALEFIVNFREDGGIPGGTDQVRIGEVRYSASRRKTSLPSVPVYVSALDFVGKRTALFGMTRTGKSNTVKKLIQSVVDLSGKHVKLGGEDLRPVGQIIFDINGEYANPNQQDSGTAIYDLYRDKTTRYSLQEKDGFLPMKVNFHKDFLAGFGLIQSHLEGEGDYVKSFLAMDLSSPEDPSDKSEATRHERKIAAYRACLHAAGFDMGGTKIRFTGRKEVNDLSGLDPKNGLTGDEAVQWFTAVWGAYDDDPFFAKYKKEHNGREWADEDLKAALVMLTRKRNSNAAATAINGFRKLIPLRKLHSAATEASFEQTIVDRLRKGQIVIIDLSQGDPQLQITYSDRICRRIFNDAMAKFIANESPNYIQFYFEEAHNLFPKKEDKDLTVIYNRIAKEGAKLRLGLVYATQEVSSISSNVLKNTQNWFVSHLNNSDELREIDKYYDYEDFVESLRRAADRGFIRMKTYSNSFVVPVQIDRFAAPTR